MLVRRRLYSSFILNYVLGTEQAKYWWAIVTFFNRFLSVSLFLFSYPTKSILILCLTNGYKRLFELRDFPKVLWSLLSRELCSERRLSSPFISSYNQLPIHGEMQSFPRHLCPKTLSMVVAECFMRRDLSLVMQVSLISLTR